MNMAECILADKNVSAHFNVDQKGRISRKLTLPVIWGNLLIRYILIATVLLFSLNPLVTHAAPDNTHYSFMSLDPCQMSEREFLRLGLPDLSDSWDLPLDSTSKLAIQSKGCGYTDDDHFILMAQRIFLNGQLANFRQIRPGSRKFGPTAWVNTIEYIKKHRVIVQKIINDPNPKLSFDGNNECDISVPLGMQYSLKDMRGPTIATPVTTLCDMLRRFVAAVI